MAENKREKIEEIKQRFRTQIAEEESAASTPNLHVNKRKKRTVKGRGNIVVEDENKLDSLIKNFQQIVEASIRSANARVMEEALKVWETDNFGNWQLDQDTIEAKRERGVDEPSKAMYETGQLLDAMEPISIPQDKGVVGGIGIKGKREDSDLTNDELMEILTTGSPHDEKFTFMTAVKERTKDDVPRRIQETLAEHISNFSDLK